MRSIDLAATAAERWRANYYKKAACGRLEWIWGDDKRLTHEKLVALGARPSVLNVERVIGNQSWTRVRCGNCGRTVKRAVELEHVASDEYGAGYLCVRCVRASLLALRNVA